VPWTLDGGAAGVLVDVTNPAAMAAQLARLLEDDAAAQEYVGRATTLVQSRFSSQAVTGAYVRLYARIA
jgi:glycosyltransferase involved in cell wall biosynthesis